MLLIHLIIMHANMAGHLSEFKEYIAKICKIFYRFCVVFTNCH